MKKNCKEMRLTMIQITMLLSYECAVFKLNRIQHNDKVGELSEFMQIQRRAYSQLLLLLSTSVE